MKKIIFILFLGLLLNGCALPPASSFKKLKITLYTSEGPKNILFSKKLNLISNNYKPNKKSPTGYYY